MGKLIIFDIKDNSLNRNKYTLCLKISEEKWKELMEKLTVPILDKENKYAEWILLSDIKEGKIKILPNEFMKYI